MVECSFRTNRAYCDFYFLFELAGDLQLPTPHEALLRGRSLPAPLAEVLARWREALVARVGFPDDLFERAVALKDRSQLASLLQRLDIEREDAGALIDAAGDLRALIVSAADAAAGARLVQHARRMLRGPRAAAVLGQLRAFFLLGSENVPLTVTPYPLSSACPIAFGSLTGRLVTLGVHPYLTPVRVIGILVHEAVHSWLDQQASRLEVDGARLEALAEPLATALGNGWTIEQLSGVPSEGPWYDVASIDESARRLFRSIATALSSGRGFHSHLPELLRRMDGWGKAEGVPRPYE